ncbi:hypothetical protein BJ878DRAFT_497142 [Calycina marina]|uniref:UBA domain-containing protein n=1 Tax=Calycina marina TaxID=1763456 RepID=A0A9P7Z7I9_9HELO|nr:hypothetical protein BJ878DRAFT_497142 [Calycina marina]
MDDLNGLDFSRPTKSNPKATLGTGNYYTSFQTGASPITSGRNTPLSAHGSGLAKPKTAPADSFSNLVAFGTAKKTTLTLQEQHDKLQASTRQKEDERRKQYDMQFGGALDSLGSMGASRTTSPGIIPPESHFARTSFQFAPTSSSSNGADDDLFAAFNKDTKVDNSSFFPPPSVTTSRTNTPGLGEQKSLNLTTPQAWQQPSSTSSIGGADFGDDDDPFDLRNLKSKPAPTSIHTFEEDDDDFLGDLGKPVEEVRRPSPLMQHVMAEPISEDLNASQQMIQSKLSDDLWDKAVAELVDMGFTAENSRRALTESGSGLDVQAAVSWILNDAHRQSKSADQGRGSIGPSPGQPQRSDSRSLANGEADLSKQAAAIGNKLFKSAGSFLSASQKKIQKTVAEFQQQEADPRQPKWMREAAEREQSGRTAGSGPPRRKASVLDVTDEALMLESGGRPPPRKSEYPSRDPDVLKKGTLSPVPRWQQDTPIDPRLRITKQAIDEQSAQAYVSPARRKKATLGPQSPPEPDLLFSSQSNPKQPSRPTSSQQLPKPAARSTPVPTKPSTPIPIRPKAPTRSIPSLSSIALESSNQHRLAGTEHFKRGDYASAHQSYTSSLSSLPLNHPITIILLCNRALTSLKTGVPREAVSDADNTLNIIGISRGDEESIDLGPGDGCGKKDMKEFWGKAMMRKAEALEQMEKWREGADAWRQCVEGGVGGATATQGRQRCEKALAPKPAVSRTATPKPKPRPVQKTALSDLVPAAPDSAAVDRLRAANIAAEKADDEKFALADKVDAKISLWRDGKRDNLRALLGSMDNVLWAGSGWKKISIADLVTTGKVKINYMKAIGKCHPDKLPQDANTEVKLIAATVFSTLNESWDKFKEQNGL